MRVPTGRPVYLAAVIDPQPEGEGTARFYLRDLSDPNADLQVADVGHNIGGGLQNPDAKLLIGGRQQTVAHLWDG